MADSWGGGFELIRTGFCMFFGVGIVWGRVFIVRLSLVLLILAGETAWARVLGAASSKFSPRSPNGSDVISSLDDDQDPRPDWDRDAFERLEASSGKAEIAEEEEIERDAKSTARRQQQPEPVLQAVVEKLAPPVVDKRKVLLRFVIPRSVPDKSVMNLNKGGLAKEKVITAKLSAADYEKVVSDEMKVKLGKLKPVLPSKSVLHMNDQELRDLCQDLEDASDLSIDTLRGASIKNFSLQVPVLLKVDRMKLIENVTGKFVALIGDSKSNLAADDPLMTKLNSGGHLDLLKQVRGPYLLCRVKVKKIEGIKGPLILVGAEFPASLRKNPKVRIVHMLSPKS